MARCKKNSACATLPLTNSSKDDTVRVPGASEDTTVFYHRSCKTCDRGSLRRSTGAARRDQVDHSSSAWQMLILHRRSDKQIHRGNCAPKTATFLILSSCSPLCSSPCAVRVRQRRTIHC